MIGICLIRTAYGLMIIHVVLSIITLVEWSTRSGAAL